MFFTLGTNATNGNNYVAAEHADGTLIGPSATIKTATPAEPGETITLFATGFGLAAAPDETLSVTPTIAIDGINAEVSFAGIVGTGSGSIQRRGPCQRHARSRRVGGWAVE